ncbi:MAG TPA: lysophospholipid acyltransferase family protein, partial [Candidatus Udaeobacter sp.]
LADPENILIIFPEGTRSKTGETLKFKSGIGALVAGRDVTVLPCYLQGTFRAWPKGRRLPRPTKIRLIVGEPRNYSSRTANKIDICTIAAELHRRVKELGEINGSD